MAERTYTIHVCPDCGEHIISSEYDSTRGAYYGHYHDPPKGWTHAEDPWFEAVQIEVVPRVAFDEGQNHYDLGYNAGHEAGLRAGFAEGQRRVASDEER